MCSVSVVRRHTELESATDPEDVREENRVADAPLDVVLVLAADDAPLDDAVLEDIEANLLVEAGRAAAIGAPEVRLLIVKQLGKVVPCVAVEVLRVGRVERVLLALQPAAGQVRDRDVTHAVFPDQGTPARQ
jgi:hypothetical protein